ncbi:MAG: ATP-dependent protease subunit HslV [bacterium]
MDQQFRGTTILAIRRNGKATLGGDGQLSYGETVVKASGKKIRRLHEGKVMAGFAGGIADALALFDLFEKKLSEYHGDLTRAVIELAKEWRMDRSLRRLEADLIVMDKKTMFLISGQGEIIEPDDDVIGMGSGGAYALAAARALLKHTKLSAKEICRAALEIAADICVYTNRNLTIEEL